MNLLNSCVVADVGGSWRYECDMEQDEERYWRRHEAIYQGVNGAVERLRHTLDYSHSHDMTTATFAKLVAMGFPTRFDYKTITGQVLITPLREHHINAMWSMVAQAEDRQSLHQMLRERAAA